MIQLLAAKKLPLAYAVSVQQRAHNSFLHNQGAPTMLQQRTHAFASPLPPHETEPMTQTWGMALTTGISQ